MTKFNDKVAIVTGGGSSIGEALCQELRHGGSIVVVASLHDDHAKRVASAVTQNGGQAQAVPVDVSNEEDVRRLIDETVSEYGRLDYLFNNADIAIFGDASDLTLEQWRRVLEVNLYSVLYGTVIANPIMVRQGFGHIVNVASSAGLYPGPTEVPYCTSKYAIVGLSLSLRVEGADVGVKVSVVCPGYVRTNIFQTATVINIPPEHRGAMTPLQNNGCLEGCTNNTEPPQNDGCLEGCTHDTGRGFKQSSHHCLSCRCPSGLALISPFASSDGSLNALCNKELSEISA